MRRFAFSMAAATGLVLAMSCGGSSMSNGGTVGTTSTSSGFVITIKNLAYSPVNLAVPPGATVTVVNDDNMPHSLTSEAASGQYTPGAVSGISFDTGDFSSGQKTFTIPASATAGTVIPFYCRVHLQTMATPNGSITINPAAQPSSSGSTTPSSTPGPAY